MIIKKSKTTKLLVAVMFFAVLIAQPFSNNAHAASSGWQTKSGITALVYTDRTGNYPASDTYIGVTAEKTSAGGTVNYQMGLQQYKNGSWIWLGNDDQFGYFSSQTPMKIFYIDKHLAKGSSGTFRVITKIYNSSDYWLGDWFTPSFTVYN